MLDLQAVMGSIVKGPLCRRLGLQPSQVYHCAIMPCYDKKLEASREDFNVAGVCMASAKGGVCFGTCETLKCSIPATDAHDAHISSVSSILVLSPVLESHAVTLTTQHTMAWCSTSV